MKIWREFALPEIGHFSEAECEEIRRKCEGSYMNIRVSWSNYAGNCMLIVCTDYFDETEDYDECEKAVKGMFIHRALTALCAR